MMRFPGPEAVTAEGADAGRESALAPLVRAFRGHPLIALAVAVATVLGGLAWIDAHPPSYTATAQLLVTPLRSNDPVLLTLPLLREAQGDPTRTVQTAAALVDSREAAALAAQRLGGRRTAQSVRRAVDVQPQGQTSIVDITATARRPQQAARLANAYARAVIDSRAALLRPRVAAALAATRAQLAHTARDAGGVRGDLQQRIGQLRELRAGVDPTLSISQQAVAPDGSAGLPRPLVLALMILAGALLATGAVLLIDLVGPRRIAAESELLRLYPLPVLARLPDLPRRRRARPGHLTIDPAVWEALRSLQIQLELEGDGSRAVMLTSPSRSDGKTSSAVSFALQLADAACEVILVDLDLRKPDVAARLGMPAAAPVATDEKGDDALDRALRPVPGHPNVRLLEGRALSLGAGSKRAADRVVELIAKTRAKADYVVIDVPPLGEVSDPLLFAPAVTDVVVVARMGNTRWASVEIVRDLLERAGCDATGYVVIGGDGGGHGYYYARRGAADRDKAVT